MDFYLSNNLTKTEFKANLSQRSSTGEWQSLGEGYPSLNFSFKKNTLSFLFFMSNAKDAQHTTNLEHYCCKRKDKNTTFLENMQRPEAYLVIFKNEECCLTFINILTNYLKIRCLNRRQLEQRTKPLWSRSDRVRNF